jgi:hypothetical protein
MGDDLTAPSDCDASPTSTQSELAELVFRFESADFPHG